MIKKYLVKRGINSEKIVATGNEFFNSEINPDFKKRSVKIYISK